MNFILNMAWREMRASWHRLLLFFLCIAIGVGSIVGLRSLVQSVNAAIRRESRLLIAADVVAGMDGTWNAEAMAMFERYFRSPLVTGHTEALELGTMVRAAAVLDAVPRLVWLTAVQPAYPLYGEVRLVQRGMLSYKSKLEAYETVVAGRFWEPAASAEPEVSLDERYGRDLGVRVGDTLTFDVVGRRITARVTSLRHISRYVWTPASDILFRPGTFEDAPQIFAAHIKGPVSVAARGQVMREIADRFPNVVVYDFVETFEAARGVVRSVSLVVTFVGGFAFLCGVLILIGSVAMTKLHRLYEAAILKTLGATRRLLVFITLVEYGVLGLLAGVIGSAAAIALSWAISTYALELEWQPLPAVNLIGVAATLLLVTAVGVLSSWDVIRKKPLDILRGE